MKKILIVEDDPYVRRLYEKIFSMYRSDIQFDMAADGAEGLEKVKTFQPTLILLDVMMPGMNGFEVLEKLKADPTTRDITTVMLTVLGDQGVYQKAMTLGAEGFIVKSDIGPDKLLKVVEMYAQKS